MYTQIYRGVTCGLRSLAHAPLGATVARVHYMNSLGGARDEAKAAVGVAFAELVVDAVGLLVQPLESRTASPTAGWQQQQQQQQLQVAALRLCALDYGADDHGLLHQCRLLPQIQRLIATPNSPTLRRTARACFKLLLHRCLGDGDDQALPLSPSSPPAALPIPTLFQHALLNALKAEVEGVGRLAAASSAVTTATAQPPAGCLLPSNEPLTLSPATLGLQAPATAAPLAADEHTLAFWLWRPRAAPESTTVRAMYRVVGGEGCLVRATPDLESPEVTTLDTGTVVEVEDPDPLHPTHPLVQSGRRVRIVHPVCGYGSRYAAMGYRILQEEVGIHPGDRVCRGPDWQQQENDEEEEEEEESGLGRVVALTDWETAEGRGVVVRWDHDAEGALHTYRYGYLGKVQEGVEMGGHGGAVDQYV
jgi:hypothetical protein